MENTAELCAISAQFSKHNGGGGEWRELPLSYQGVVSEVFKYIYIHIPFI